MQLKLEIRYTRRINWSLLRAGIPAIWQIAIRNCASRAAKGLKLRISVPKYLDTGLLSLPEIPPKAVHRITYRELTWLTVDFEAAMRLTRPVESTYLMVELGGGKAECPVTLLTPDEWRCGVAQSDCGFVTDSTVELADVSIDLPPGGAVKERPLEKTWDDLPPLPMASASLILPEHPVVDQIKQKTIEMLAAIVGKARPALGSYLSGTSQQTKVVQAVFAALLNLYPNAFHDIQKYSLETRSQRVRLPEETVAEPATARHGATCVDFALLMCAVMEACGLEPLFILVGVDRNLCHALAGCWLFRAAANEMMIADATSMRSYMDDGYLLAVDVTEFSKGKDYSQACKKARACLRPSYDFCYAVDIALARRPPAIRPLPWSAKPASSPRVAPRIVHALKPSPNFQERPELDKVRSFWRESRGGVLGLVGLGGEGKTAIVERFLCELPGSSVHSLSVGKRTDLPNADFLFCWSFHENPNCVEFLEELRAYICGARSDLRDADWARAEIQKTLTGSPGSRALLVLDSVERLQEVSDVFGGLRADAVSLGKLLQQAASSDLGLWVILTTRLSVANLGAWRNRNYTELPVERLDAGSSCALLRELGVHGTDRALRQLCEHFKGHAMTLAHLGSVLNAYCGGDVGRAKDLPALQDIGGDPVLDAQAYSLGQVLAHYENVLPQEELAVLKAVCAFRLPVDTETLLGLFASFDSAGRSLAVMPAMTEVRLLQALRRLTESRLLQSQAVKGKTSQYSAHPLVTHYFSKAFQEDLILLHEGAHNYLMRKIQKGEFRVQVRGAVRTRGAATRVPSEARFPTETHVLNLLEEAIHHALKAGRAEEAYRLYRDMLGGYEHLATTLRDYGRGERITALFLSPGDTAVAESFPWFDSLRHDHERFLKALVGPEPSGKEI